MFESFVKVRLALLGVLVAMMVFGLMETAFEWSGQGAVSRSATASHELTVAFLSVGQGDAIFIETPDGVQMLIDGGPSSGVLRELSKQMPFFDRSIDMVMATHADKDHIGGLIDVLHRYEVSDIILTEAEKDTGVFDSFNLAVDDEEAKVYFAQVGQKIVLGASTTLEILSPAGNTVDLESNTASIVAKLTYGEIDFMFTGDAPASIENYLAKTYGDALESEVLKLGHHGSKTSTSEEFLRTVKPVYGVISAGLDNRYGHPHYEVVLRANEQGVDLLNTATDGTVVFKSDGKEVWLE